MTSPRSIPDPLQFAEDTLRGFKKKSDHNKSESLACFALAGC